MNLAEQVTSRLTVSRVIPVIAIPTPKRTPDDTFPKKRHPRCHRNSSNLRVRVA